MHIGKLLIVVIALSALAGCATYYHGPRESERHATLTFEKRKEWLGHRPWPRKLNGRQPSEWFGRRRTFRVGVGTMRLELANGPKGDLFTCGPRYTCELSFEAEAGRRYLVSMLWEDEVYLYAVTADNGTKVAECKAQDACEWRCGAYRGSRECCPNPSAPSGQGKGEGAIVIRDDALVYKKVDSSTRVTWKLKRGDAVVANYSRKSEAWQFYEESGRVQIAFLDEGRLRGGWMRLDDLAKFTYDCNYDPFINPVPGYPFKPGIRIHNWNVCFQEARDAKLKEQRVTWAEEQAATSTKAQPGASPQDPGGLDERPAACGTKLQDRQALNGWIMGTPVGLELLHAGILDANFFSNQLDFLLKAVPLSSPAELTVHALRRPTLGQRQGGLGERDDLNDRRADATGPASG